MNALRGLGLIAAAYLFAACGGSRGSGTAVSQERAVGPFARVLVGDALQVKLTERAPESISVTADDNLQELIITEVKDDVLTLTVKEHTHLLPSAPIVIEVPRAQVNWVNASGAAKVESAAGLLCTGLAIDASGAASVTLDSLDGDEVWVRASGASQVNVRSLKSGKTHLKLSGASRVDFTTGSFGALDADASGASVLSAKPVVAGDAALDVSGASTVRLSVTGALTGQASGASRVEVSGTPSSRALETSGGSSVAFDE